MADPGLARLGPENDRRSDVAAGGWHSEAVVPRVVGDRPCHLCRGPSPDSAALPQVRQGNRGQAAAPRTALGRMRAESRSRSRADASRTRRLWRMERCERSLLPPRTGGRLPPHRGESIARPPCLHQRAAQHARAASSRNNVAAQTDPHCELRFGHRFRSARTPSQLYMRLPFPQRSLGSGGATRRRVLLGHG